MAKTERLYGHSTLNGDTKAQAEISIASALDALEALALEQNREVLWDVGHPRTERGEPQHRQPNVDRHSGATFHSQRDHRKRDGSEEMNAPKRSRSEAPLGLPTGESITCPKCHRTSYNPHDIAQGYCGFCHTWTSGPIVAIIGGAISRGPLTNPEMRKLEDAIKPVSKAVFDEASRSERAILIATLTVMVVVGLVAISAFALVIELIVNRG